MTQHYSDPSREHDEHALPDLETFQLTAREAAEQDEDTIYEFMKRCEFRLATMNSKVRDAMFDAIIRENCIEGGWFYWFCFPGCMPDSPAIGPFATQAEALADARQSNE